jgi:tripartite-type tricarboxylate transporter receptor subunit TctC
MPQVPTGAEAGLADFKYESWFGLMAPGGTPRAVLQRISKDVAQVLGQSDVRDKMQRQGALPVTTTPEQFDVIIRDDTARNTKLLREAGVGTR